MGADLILYTFLTDREINTDAILTPEAFAERLPALLAEVTDEQFDGWLEDYLGGALWDLEDMFPADEADKDSATTAAARRKEIEDIALRSLRSGYDTLMMGIAGRHRYFSHRNMGDVTMWMTGGTSYGESPYDGMMEFEALIGSIYYLPGMPELLSWVRLAARGCHDSEDGTPIAYGLATSHAASILVHAALTHPDADVRAELIANPTVPFSLEDLEKLSRDDDERVRDSASRRIIEIAASA